MKDGEGVALPVVAWLAFQATKGKLGGRTEIGDVAAYGMILGGEPQLDPWVLNDPLGKEIDTPISPTADPAISPVPIRNARTELLTLVEGIRSASTILAIPRPSVDRKEIMPTAANGYDGAADK